MPRPVVYPVVFGTLSGQVSASTIDQDFNASGSAINDSASGWVNAATDTGSANSYIVTLNPPANQYSNGFYLAFLPLNQNTGPSSINVNGLGSVPILKVDGSALTPQSLQPGTLYEMICINGAFRVISPNLSPLIGEIALYAGFTTPGFNWLLCNGQAIGRTQFAALFAVIGTTYGVGNGSTTFNIPDLSTGQFPCGTTRGTTGGGTATLSVANLPAHSHAATVTDPGHFHTVAAPTTPIGVQAGGATLFQPTTTATSVNPANVTVGIGNTGSGTPITVTPKFVGVEFVIRAF